MNQEKERRLSVLNQVIAWRGGRKEAVDCVISFPDSNHKIFVWSFHDRGTPEHLVIHHFGPNAFDRHEVRVGHLGEVVEALVGASLAESGQCQQQALALPASA